LNSFPFTRPTTHTKHNHTTARHQQTHKPLTLLTPARMAGDQCRWAVGQYPGDFS
jgi:hypothetical protein